ncbi:hypothetical protein BH747_05010 [Enterococcus villorum]|uniref:Bacterial Ig domain-containing protein n=1 Tax=Enterococcus villorum TaxID=112904 RepID=A0A1V8YDT9_9ENTE|nr:immunoglobulin-like domain-containing protein [Enterococcus villorum]OQO70762.1 hypothetical protein BH747_05010 [Enterococcus villorum]
MKYKRNIKMKEYTLGKDTHVSGELLGNIKTIRLEVDGELKRGSTLDFKDKTAFNYYAIDKIKSKHSKVYMVAFDDNDQYVLKRRVKIK